MAEYRLAKVANELNRSFQALADLLNQRGFDVIPKPTTKITEEMHQALLLEFSKDKAAKEESKLLKIAKDFEVVAPKISPTRETPILTVEEKVVLLPIAEKTLPPTSEKIAFKKQDLAGPKIIGKIPIASTEKKSASEAAVTPKKISPSEQTKAIEPTVEPIVEPTVEPIVEPIVGPPVGATKKASEIVVEPPVSAPTSTEKVLDEEVKKIDTKFEKLSGTKVLGKIELAKTAPTGVKSLAGEARDELREKRKRKRSGTEKVAVQERVKIEQRSEIKSPDPKAIISKEAVQQKVKNTMRQMGSAGKSRGSKRKIKLQNKETRATEKKEDNLRREKEDKILKVSEFLTANELATMMNIGVTQVISTCFMLGVVVSINQRLDAETIQIVSDNFGFEVEFVDAESQIEAIDNSTEDLKDLVHRAPIVTVMGHVDHGKTSLLDYIRKANVIAGEAGGITQHIGAYEVTLADGKKITFLDTPGHEAFTAMRARGAKVTDLVIIVIAADDSVMPQTREAISHAQAAGVPMVFAFNKIDKEGANSEKIREQLSGMNILVEDWGGKFQCQEISAKKGLNIEKLLDKVLLEAEMMDLKANPNRRAKGTVIEATQEKGRGIVCSMLVQNGTLRVGDHVVVGPYYAKVRALYNERDGKIDSAPPSTPVKMLGFTNAPTAGDAYIVFEDESEAKTLANKRLQLVREQGIRTKRHITLDEIGRRLAIGNFKELKLIVKGDVDGSVEALSDSLLKLSTEEIAVNVIHSGVGQITESDILLASASDAIIVGFQVRPSAKAKQIAENEEIDIRTYSVIYQAIDEIKAAMEGMLSPEVIEKIIGNVEVREVFKISKVGTIAGCYVTSGIIERKSKLRVIRDGVVVFAGELSSLKRFKDDVKEIAKGYECGLQIDRYNDVQAGDYLEIFKEEEVKRKL
ncbi:MAG: translation initiation factor IF-2 [Flavobacteriales bacterium]|nr:MAG: translation initiation factor IF-2 [Flavobacteriales bacterium]